MTEAGSALLAATGSAPFVFVVGKGGAGKSTTAAGLALGLADAGAAVHLLSTDPAHSVGDVFGQALGGSAETSACSPSLLLEELDAEAAARRWLEHATGPVSELVEQGTYLDAEDVAGFTRLALPGLDEMMAVLRLVELAAGERRVVVDTAPTGHTLRLLDAAAAHESLAQALRAMAEKAGAVASMLARRSLRLTGESIIDELDAAVRTFRDDVLGRAAFVVATRPGDLVSAETGRLIDALRHRRLHVAALVFTGAADGAGPARHAGLLRAAADPPCCAVPILANPVGCDGLRGWLAALRPCAPAADAGDDAGRALPDADVTDAPGAALAGAGNRAGRVLADADVTGNAPADAARWLVEQAPRLLLFAGKGGVGKTTCAAAVAVLLAESRDVLLCSTDPAGSLDDVFGGSAGGRPAARLKVVQVEAAAELERARQAYRGEVVAALERIGLSESAVLDRRVIEAILELEPPGIDEFAALAALLDIAESSETVVLDTAPTGHFLRLLTMPQLALDWTRQLMRILVKYRAAGAAAETADALLRSARELRALQAQLRDRAAAAVIVVTLPEPVVAAETDRLLRRLHEADVAVMARLTNRAGAREDGTDRPGTARTADAAGGPDGPDGPAGWRRIHAPERRPAPIGSAALRDFIGDWSIVA